MEITPRVKEGEQIVKRAGKDGRFWGEKEGEGEASGKRLGIEDQMVDDEEDKKGFPWERDGDEEGEEYYLDEIEDEEGEWCDND